MRARITIFVLVLFLGLQSTLILAQDGSLTCDGGPNDVVNALRAAFDAGDLETAQDLVTQAERLCPAMSDRLPVVRVLAGRIEQQLNPEPTLAPEPELLLAEDGPYFASTQTLMFSDSDRSGRTLAAEIVYPAIRPEDLSTDRVEANVMPGVEPDTSNARYPLILFSHWWSSNASTDMELFAHLASHGFVVASIEHSCDMSPTCLVDRPMDLLFVLDQLAKLDEGNLAEMIDTDQVGVMGISFGGYTTLATAGGRIDPDHFIAWAANEGSLRGCFGADEQLCWDAYVNNTVAAQWDEVAAYRAEFDALTQGEPWPSITDDRIRAVMPMVPSMGMLFGEHGLESVAVPTLMLAGTSDRLVPYEEQIVPMYAQLNPDERTLISLIRYRHHPEYEPKGSAYYKHFSTAFFGFYLQEEDYAEYFTETYVNSFHDLTWGVYER